jgi:IclR family transcriptional regulator, acetate operon repressor
MERMPVSAMTRPSGSQAIDRAASLLKQVVDATGAVTFSELAAASGLAKSTTSRILSALERNGLVRREPGGAFTPGDAFVKYALRGNADTDLVSVAQPFLERLGEHCGETINLGVVRNGMVEQIAQVDSRYVLGATNWLGRPVPLHCTALGKVFLASHVTALPPGRLARLTERTITVRTELEEELADVRRRGYATTEEELETGLSALAAPVQRLGGTVVAAISVSGPTTRFGVSRFDEVAQQCITEAHALSTVLGYQQQKEGAA